LRRTDHGRHSTVPRAPTRRPARVAAASMPRRSRR